MSGSPTEKMEGGATDPTGGYSKRQAPPPPVQEEEEGTGEGAAMGSDPEGGIRPVPHSAPLPQAGLVFVQKSKT